MNALLQSYRLIWKRSFWTKASVVFQLAATLLLLTQPLFNEFDYEFNEILSVILIFTSPVWAAESARILAEISVEKRTTNLYIFSIIIVTSILNAGLSFLTIFGYSFFANGCGGTRGLFWFLLLPLPATIFGCSLGYGLSGWFRRFQKSSVYVVIVVAIAYNIWIVFSRVPIFVYSNFFGYFAGPIYDELIPIDSTLVWFRIGTVLWGLFLGFIGVYGWNKKSGQDFGRLWMVPGMIALSILAIELNREAIGFDVSYSKLEAELAGEIQTQHVRLKFDPGIDSTSIRLLAAQSEFFYRQNYRALNLSADRLVTLFVYRDAQQKKKLMGAGSTNFAKIWRNEIHVNADEAEAVLRHEIVHVLAGAFANRYYSTRRIGFLEGLAVAIEWNENYFTPHEWSAALKRLNKLPPVLPMIEGENFFWTASGMSYIISGSFVKFLIDTYGIERFKHAYNDSTLEEVYRKTGEALIGEWSQNLDSIVITEQDVHFAELLIQPSLFQRRCPHRVAEISAQAFEAYARNDYEEAGRWFDQALAIDPDNYGLRMSRIRCWYYSRYFDEALEALNLLFDSKKMNYAASASAMVLKGDMFLQLSQPDSALAIYTSALKNYGHIRNIYISAHLRLSFFNNLEQVSALKQLLETENRGEQLNILERVIIENPKLKLPVYWKGRVWHNQGNWGNAVATLDTISFNDPIFELDRLQRLGDSSIRLFNAQKAITYYDRALVVAKRPMDREALEQKRSFALWYISSWN
ncbi:hypothetical protein K1X84_10675 [bacterium]|nr:hypothetical protein [bacterium]